MAKMEPIRGEITVKLSQTDRELLKTLMRGLGIDPDDEKSFADATRRLTGRLESGEKVLSQGEVQAAGAAMLRRLAEQPQAEGDWLLETERAEAGDDVD